MTSTDVARIALPEGWECQIDNALRAMTVWDDGPHEQINAVIASWLAAAAAGSDSLIELPADWRAQLDDVLAEYDDSFSWETLDRICALIEVWQGTEPWREQDEL